MRYTVLIVDDEPPARALLADFVSRLDDLHCLASCANALQALQVLQTQPPDLVLLDIQMPELTGLQLLSMPLMPRPAVILTTAYPQYALTSYDYAVVDYLLKPIAFERFVNAIHKFRQQKDRAAVQQPAPPASTDSLVWLRQDKQLRQIAPTSVLFVEGLRDYVKVHLMDEFILTHLSIGQAEALFKPPRFVRVHRSYLVQLSAIRLIEGNTLTLLTGRQLPIGPHYRQQLRHYVPNLH